MTRGLIAALLDAIDGRDAATLRRILHDEFTYRVPASLPAGGIYRGKETLIQMLCYADQIYRRETMRYDREPPLVDGGRAAWRFTLSAVAIDGTRYENRYAMFIGIADGQIIELEEQLDTLCLDRAILSRVPAPDVGGTTQRNPSNEETNL